MKVWGKAASAAIEATVSYAEAAVKIINEDGYTKQ